MIFNKIENHKTNGYFVIILFVVGAQRFIYALEFLGVFEHIYSPLQRNLSLGLYIVPIYYLFFRRLIEGADQLKKELLHFILPTLFILLNVVFVDYEMNHVFFLVYSTFYFVCILILLKNFIYRKKISMLDQISYRHLKTWLLLMISLTFVLFVYSNYFLISEADSKLNIGVFYRYSSLFWLVVLLYIYKNPIVIFGEHYLYKNLHLNEPSGFLIWSEKLLKQVEEKDKIVYSTIVKRVGFIISDIQILQKSAPILSTTTLTADTLSKKMKIPRRHLEFVFKYYCHYSINDFSNLVKIKYAVSLINEGYLDSYTVASLGEKCLFNSRFTFSKNFKKFIGISVSDYVSANVNSRLFILNNVN